MALLLSQISPIEIVGLRSPALLVQASVLAALFVGTLVRLVTLRFKTPDAAWQSLLSLASWWVIVLVLFAASFAGRIGGVAVFAAISGFAMTEFLQMTKVGSHRWPVQATIYLLIALNYVWILLGWREVFLAFIPLASFVLISFRIMTRLSAANDLVISAATHWGLLLTTYCVSFAPLLLTLQNDSNPQAGVVGWFLFLLILTGVSDIFQALIGRPFGKHKIAPVLSPHKSWEGFVAGVVMTTACAVLLANFLTPLNDHPIAIGGYALPIPFLPAALAGMLISVVGFFGDLTISALKRDLHIKDSGNWLPGQGGISDRIDSLMYAAPAFYLFVLLLGYR
ncbi:MAG: phosphatidate cytidylyltransferase [bacterium]|nr:phosphatidate cytidylyltransferase [bacterium]